MIRHFDALLKILASVLVVVLLGTVNAGVIFRAINHPLSWTDAISGFLMVWLACLGWMIATRHGSHIRIRLLQDRLPPVTWRATEVLIQRAVATIGAVVAYKCIHLVQVNADIEAVSLPVSTAWMYAPLIPAGALTVLQAIWDLWTSRRPEPRAEVLTP